MISTKHKHRATSVVFLTITWACAGELQAGGDRSDLPWQRHGELVVSSSGRSLAFADGTPFVWLGTTAWALHQNVSREDVEFYLDNVKASRFTVVQLFSANRWALNDYKNYYGATPYQDGNPTLLNPDYWAHTRWVIEEAANRGLYIYFVYGSPGRKDEGMPFAKTPREAYDYGCSVGEVLRGLPNLLWAGGMDNDPTDEAKLAPMGYDGWHAMAEGVNDGIANTRGYDGRSDYSRTLMTFHVNGQNTSTPYFHDAPWLDFNMGQLGVQEGSGNDTVLVARTIDGFRRRPVKPFLSLEPWYENNTWRTKPVDDYEMRVQAYQSLMAGAAGFSYGNKYIWPMSRPRASNRDSWKDALDDPGRLQMQHVHAFLNRYPDDRYPDLDHRLVTGSQEQVHKSMRLMKRIAGCYTLQRDKAFIYSPEGRPFEFDRSFLARPKVKATWFDTRLGATTEMDVTDEKNQWATPPRSGTDWLLIVEGD